MHVLKRCDENKLNIIYQHEIANLKIMRYYYTSIRMGKFQKH